jgi:hypothetical protein
MTEPVVDKPEFPREYGNPTQRHEARRPHVVPRDGTWLDGGPYCGGRPETVHVRNTAKNPPTRFRFT